jgi:hypothetical protein
VPEVRLFAVEEAIQLALIDDFSMDTVTSGSDPIMWEPISIIDEDQADERKEEEEPDGTADAPADPPAKDEGVTSGADSDTWVNVKSSERKPRKR